MSQIPDQLQYNKLQTKGFYSQFQLYTVEPVTSNQYWPGQIIKIFFTGLISGVMDPFKSHIKMQVSTNQQLLPVGQLQVDNSAQSFIQQLVLLSKNRQIQRINQYGILAAYLNDLGISQIYAEGRQTQGLGYSNLQTFSTYFSSSNQQLGSRNQNSDHTMYNHSPATSFPTIPSRYPYATTWGAFGGASSQQAYSARAHMNNMNPAWLGTRLPQVFWWNKYILADSTAQDVSINTITSSISNYGYLYNMRAQYVYSINSNKWVDHTLSCPGYQIRVDPSVMNNSFPAKWNNNKPYKVYIPDSIPKSWTYQTPPGTDPIDQFQIIPNTTTLNGFSNLQSPLFSRGTNQPFISPTVPQCQMINGKILQKKIPIATRTFKFPLLSAVMGILIPQSQYMLLPVQALNDVLMQFTIDQCAMFSSGYCDIGQFDDVGMNKQQERAFQITNIVYNMHTYQFFNPQIDQYLKLSLANGIAINTNYWQQANQFSIQSGQAVSNTYPISCIQQVLQQIVCLFYPNDYRYWSFCRKHFRISNNVTQFQIRVNMQWYPIQPYLGNGGNPIAPDPQSGDNSVFIENIYYSTDNMFSNLNPQPRINAYNFAINQRCYNPSNFQTLYDPAMISDPTYVWRNQSINQDTALGMSAIHQNRWVGKAAYVFSFVPYRHSRDYLIGLNVKSTKNLDVFFKTSPQSWFPRPQTLYIFTKSANIIQFSKRGIININK